MNYIIKQKKIKSERPSVAASNGRKQDQFSDLQEWAKLGIKLTTLPKLEDYGSEDAELALLRYCYYRLIYHIAGKLCSQSSCNLPEGIDVFLSTPFGNCVTKEIIIGFCEFIMESAIRRPWCDGEFFPDGCTTHDVAIPIYNQKGGNKDLLESAIKDRSLFF